MGDPGPAPSAQALLGSARLGDRGRLYRARNVRDDDLRPEFQRIFNAATTKPPAFDIIVVPSFSYFFRDQFQLEFYIQRLTKNRVRFVSIIQELGDDPISTTIRQIMAMFDEFKHTSLVMKESARHGFCNGSLPPMGYRIVEAAEQPGHCTKNPGAADPPSGTGS